jgi:hypothetical protein
MCITAVIHICGYASRATAPDPGACAGKLSDLPDNVGCGRVEGTEGVLVDEERPWIAQIMREYEALEVADQQAADRARERREARTKRTGPNRSVVYTVRLEPEQVEALERRAAMAGVRPTVLARNLIRIGLAAAARGSMGGSRPSVVSVPDALGEVEGAVAALRALVS